MTIERGGLREPTTPQPVECTDHETRCLICKDALDDCGICKIELRSFLCPRCNVMIGMATDCPEILEKGSDYLAARKV